MRLKQLFLLFTICCILSGCSSKNIPDSSNPATSETIKKTSTTVESGNTGSDNSTRDTVSIPSENTSAKIEVDDKKSVNTDYKIENNASKYKQLEDKIDSIILQTTD